jgi:hypothetical protein
MSAHDVFLDVTEPRVIAALGLALLISPGVAPRDANGIRDLAHRLAAALNIALIGQGWQARPGFPGRTLGVEPVGEQLRMTCATELWSGPDKIGIAYLVIVSGRAATVSVGPPECSIPDEWQTLPNEDT